MYKITSQDVTIKDYPILHAFTGSSRREEADISEILDYLSFVLMKQELPRQPFFYRSLLPLFEIDLSSVSQHFEVKNESTLMEKEVWEKETILPRILNFVDKVIEEGEVFSKLDKKKLMSSLSFLVKSISPEELETVSDDELTRRIEKIMAIEVMSVLLSDLSQEQIEVFETALKRRDLFR